MKKTIIPFSTSGWEWLDIESPSAEELQQIAQVYGLHPSTVIDSLQPEHLPKFEEIEEITFIIGRIYDSKSGKEADTIQELTNKVAIFYSEKFIITIHRNPMALLEEVEKKFLAAGVTPGPLPLLGRLLRGIFKTYEAPALKLAEELDYYETKTFLTPKLPPLTRGLYHLKRKAAVSKRVIQLSGVILENLPLLGFPSTEVQDLRDLFVKLETQYEEISDSTVNLINIYLSISSQKTNEVMRVLTIFSAFFLPLTFIAGIYGMNFEYMPELRQPAAYPLLLAGMAGVTLFIYRWFRSKGWL